MTSQTNLAAGVSPGPVGPLGSNQTVSVDNSQDLQNALLSASAGETILLQPGVYDPFVVNGANPSSMVTVQSASQSSPAVLTGMTLFSSSNIKFEDVTFDASHTPIGVWGGEYTYLVTTYGGSNIWFNDDTFQGASSVSVDKSVSATLFRNGQNIAVTNSSFDNFHNGINHLNLDGFSVENSSFNHIFDDGIRGGGTSNAEISANSFKNFHTDPNDKDHPDTIQFWTSNTSTPAINIDVSNNVYVRGEGAPVQGVFITDQVGYLPYQNVSITGNIYVGSLWNGIRVQHANDLNVSDNILISYPDNWTALEVYGINGGSIVGNAANRYIYSGNKDLNWSGNSYNDVMPLGYEPALPAMAAAPSLSFGQSPQSASLAVTLASFSSFSAPASGTPPMSPAPEPSAWIMMSLGMALFGGLKRREAKRARRRALGTWRPFGVSSPAGCSSAESPWSPAASEAAWPR